MARTKGSDDLYTLIHQLTPQEKGYFKKFAKRYSNDGSNYQKLFDTIRAQKEFEEESLKHVFKGYARMKVYLFDMIIDSLVQNLSEGKSNTVDLLKLYARAMLMEKKGFLSHATKAYRSGLKVADDGVNQLFGFYFNQELLRLMGTNSSHRNYFKNSGKVVEDMLARLDKERLILRLEREKAKLKAHISKEEFGINHEVVKADIDFDVLLDRSLEIPYSLRGSCDEALITYYCIVNMYNEALNLAKLNLANAEKLNKKQDIPNTYSRAIIHYAMPCAYLHMHKEAHRKLEEMLKIKVENLAVKSNIQMRYVNYKLMQYAYAHDIENGCAFITKAEDTYPIVFDGKKPGHYYTQIIAYASYLLFYSNDYSRCINYLNALNLPYVHKHMPYTYRDLEIMRLMLQVEFGNYDLLHNMLRSVITKLNKAGLIDPFTKLLLNFFKDTMKFGKRVDKESHLAKMNKVINVNGAHSFMGMKLYTDYIQELKLK